MEGLEVIEPAKLSDDFAEAGFGSQFLEGLRIVAANRIFSGKMTKNEVVG